MRSTKGTLRCSPGSRTRENLPRRSTTHALCCGTMRTPSKMKTTIIAITNTAMLTVTLRETTAAATVRITATRVFQNMCGLLSCSFVRLLELPGRGLGDDQRLSFLRIDVEGGSRHRPDGGVGDARVPGGAAVLHAREPRALVGPLLQHHRLATIEEIRAPLVGLAV